MSKKTKIKTKAFPGEEEIVRTETKTVYSQNNDSCDQNNDGQYLEIETQEAGGGHYIILKTDRWALDLDSLEEFLDILKDFKKRI